MWYHWKGETLRGSFLPHVGLAVVVITMATAPEVSLSSRPLVGIMYPCDIYEKNSMYSRSHNFGSAGGNSTNFCTGNNKDLLRSLH